MERESPNRQDMGAKKYREMIHKASKKAMDDPRLPFKPVPKSKIRTSSSRSFKCRECGAYLQGTKFTYMIHCSSCGKLVKVDSEYASE